MKKIVALALVLVMVFALCACGGGKGNDAAGTWKLTGMFEDGEDYSEYVALFQMTMVLNSDGTGYMEAYGEKAELTWDADGITIDGETETFTVSGNELTIEEDGAKLVFTRQ